MTRAILTCFHKYTPFGGEFYEPIFDFYMQNMVKHKDEFDKLYLLDSTWDIRIVPDFAEVIKVDPSLRYYDAYKKVLPDIKEDLVMLMDDDMVVYKKDRITETFLRLVPSAISGTKYAFDVVSIYDTIGTMKVDLPNGKNKFCPYWFATKKDLLMKYLDVDWSPDAMPYTETLGLLTEAMLKGGARPYEWEEDKSSIYLDGTADTNVSWKRPPGTEDDGRGIDRFEHSKDLGYYHIRAGSTPAYLLATEKYGDKKTYMDYIQNQPKREYLRQLAWYWYMLAETKNMEIDTNPILRDTDVSLPKWMEYYQKFKLFHGL